ncbi:MAG TPA: fumarylacetoacetate hydrolase family protein [Hyphomicrobiales bacterium]|nr:fumarylacetoacetate hydrolase family protein [Hyphomicrobiales bacterium]
MRVAWFDDHRLGLVEGALVYDVTAALDRLPPQTYPGPWGDPLISHLGPMREAILAARLHAPTLAIDAVRFRSPVARPSKIIGTPVNYLKHAEEAESNAEVFTHRYQGGIEQQGLFLKAVSALVGPGDGVAVRFPERRTDHEMELGVVIGRKAANVTQAEALSCVAGYAIALDMVVRGPEDRSFRKSVDSYAVLGPWLVTADEVADPGNLAFRLAVNGELRQQSNTRFMILDIARQIAWASSYYTLWPGDIIMTGTCEGVGPVLPGDVMECEIDGIGAMKIAVGSAAG